MIEKTTKKKKLDLKNVLRAIDKREYGFYENLEKDLQKEFSPFVMMRFVSNVKGDEDTQEWFIERTNELVNKNHWLLANKHKNLMWKLLAATGVGVPCFHPYIGQPKVELHKIEKLIAELNPTMKIEDVKLLASMMSDEDKQELFDKMGFDKKDRKEYE